MTIIENHDDKTIEISKKIKDRVEFHNNRTVFYKSVIFLFLEPFSICLTFWLLTSPDIPFAPYQDIQPGGAIGYCFLLLFIIFGLTTLTYVLGLHNHDQIIYNMSLTFILLGMYVSGYVWGGWDNFFFRFLMTLGCLFLGVVISVPLSLVMKNNIEYRKSKRFLEENNIDVKEDKKDDSESEKEPDKEEKS